jgi:hypothetical protein
VEPAAAAVRALPAAAVLPAVVVVVVAEEAADESQCKLPNSISTCHENFHWKYHNGPENSAGLGEALRLDSFAGLRPAH